jgi:serine/threonine-protein kinase
VLPVRQVIDVVIQVALGLDYAHEHGIVHRDVKPSNIMMIRDGHVKITDFGIARMESASVRTQTGMVLGSPKYMSPEQVMGKMIDARSDIFSLGVMLYEMLVGKAPFVGENVNAIMYQTLNGIPPPPSSINATVPEMLNFIVAKALAKNLDDRYQSAKELANDLRTCRDNLPRESDKPSHATVASSAQRIVRVEKSEGTEQLPALGLSPAFDSFSATMRLAAMTTSSEDIDELSKTFKMVRPSMEEIQTAGVSLASTQQPVSSVIIKNPITSTANSAQKTEKPTVQVGGNVWIVIVVFVLIGLVFALLM